MMIVAGHEPEAVESVDHSLDLIVVLACGAAAEGVDAEVDKNAEAVALASTVAEGTDVVQAAGQDAQRLA